MTDRYARQERLPGFGATGQARLRASSVLVIGAGGLGSTVIPMLAGAGVGTIGIVDDDRVELSNLHRQHLHSTESIGTSKAQSAAARAAAINPDPTVRVIDERLTAENALDLVAGYDLVIDGSDNFPTRYLANDASVLTGVPLVWGAVSQFGGQAGVSWFERGPTYRDLFPTPPAPGSVLSCEAGGVLPSTVGVIGSIMASEALKIITGLGEPLIGRVTLYDALTGGFRELAYDRDPTAQPITGLIDYERFCGLARTLTPREVAALDGATILDVREPWEVELVALPGAVTIPLGSLEDAIGAGALDRGAPVVVVCHHGIRSATARDLLEAHGFDASHLGGGIDAWARDLDPAMVRY